MGHPTNAALDKLAPVAAGGCWIDDPETEGGQLLRPDFSASWTDNSVWHASVVSFAKTHLAAVSPTLSDKDVEALQDSILKGHIQTVFKGITTKYRKWAKSLVKAPAPIAHNDLKIAVHAEKSV
jgi:predicted nucleic acid-binding protein